VTGRFATDEVQGYYDRHTDTFMAYGQGGAYGAIHRAVWGPGTRSRSDAFRYVESQIVDCLHRLDPGPDDTNRPHVVDLGCGVGSSLCYLAERLPILGTGVTLSPVQARRGTQIIRDAGLSDRVRCVEGDYLQLPDTIETADLAYAIESFVHGPDPQRFFAQCAQLIRPGGFLLLCDDFRRPVSDRRAEPVIDQFCRGWHVNALLAPDELTVMAENAGFDHEGTTDLTRYLELGRPRDRAIDLLVALVGWIPACARRFDHLVGGNALQTCLKKGWIGYDLASFRRR
jgi:SAM-dependent methyltransferase